eukprot:CAMPEP_0197466988 /NCGR_PEP_ID=MMETSP1175-20131217/65337_1 /TAXON_ID=1003142 /ORGANISM="Triceratium dubium, Strain CCMP147" /LENGTH=609 /DNA_ID=CAMNT_0043003047 /DNA_START=1 /DNA_END=1830 /DNA_ORIENTATION=+
MDDDDYSNASEDYEYQYSDDDEDNESGGGGYKDDDDYEDAMEMDGDDHDQSGESGDKKRSSSSKRHMTSSSGSGRADNPNAAPMGGGGAAAGGAAASAGGFGDILGDQDSGSSIRMVDSSDLVPIMKRRLREVTEVLDIPASAAAVLMREHKWAKERLFETFYEDPDKVLKQCGVYARCRKDEFGGGGKKPAAAAQPQSTGRVTRSSAAAKRSASQKVQCQICYDEDGFDPAEMMAMPCGHEFCLDCWRGFLEVAVTNGPASVMTTCPQAGCNEIVTEEELRRAATDVLPKFEGYQLRSFVEMNGLTRWCPGPGCERVAIGTARCIDAAGDARCDACTTCFCLRCGEEPHAPVTCRDLVRWNEKCRNESETANWILANTKPCPKCSSRIEKNQGCNHMSCQQCKYEFCWICMGNWNEHGANTGGYYRCNKFDPNDGDKTDQSEAAKAKRELDRYLHYYKRFHAHAEAQKFAKRQLRETEQRMVLLQEQSSDATWTDVEFLKAANEQLVECRRVLKYTYSFAFYLTEPAGVSKNMTDASASAGTGSQKAMRRERFEYHQEMLERFTENLSELSEKPLSEMDRTEVVNVTRVVDRFMKNILKYVEDGMEEG